MIGLHTALIILRVVFSLVNTGVYLIVNTFIYIFTCMQENTGTLNLNLMVYFPEF